jgi:hypothetical protein
MRGYSEQAKSELESMEKQGVVTQDSRMKALDQENREWASVIAKDQRLVDEYKAAEVEISKAYDEEKTVTEAIRDCFLRNWS